MCFQVWFQNRRMKDKRQRMAMAWPYGIADPNIYAYIMNAAASLSQYPYPPAAMPSTTPLNYYASLGLQRAAAAYTPYGMHTPLRPRSEMIPGSPLLRAGVPGADPHAAAAAAAAAAASTPCNLNPAVREPLMTSHHQGGILHGHHTPCSASGGDPCTCPGVTGLLYPGCLPTVSTAPPTSIATPTPLLPSRVHTPPSASTPSQSSPPSQPTLFQPYKTDSERAWGMTS